MENDEEKAKTFPVDFPLFYGFVGGGEKLDLNDEKNKIVELIPVIFSKI